MPFFSGRELESGLKMRNSTATCHTLHKSAIGPIVTCPIRHWGGHSLGPPEIPDDGSSVV